MIRLGRRHAAMRATSASLDRGIDDPRDLEKQVPRLKLVTEANSMNTPEFTARITTAHT
ncbi:MAG TPA: hypothetical protein VK436_06785 [Methanocella sp.]|nr:hypothetical protein [Methanocella sp.]